ncbi:MAG TPA: phosphate ABC transporter substrate-binding protein PstS [Chloroflexia bacterium]|nr:phosphate ABC transporter substrate-binding protein PstS [Chloroflexia bacterium]
MVFRPFLRRTQLGILTGLTAASLLLSACGGDATATTAPSGTGGAPTATGAAAAAAPTNTPVQVGSGSITLTGAGATFPVPIYSKWFQQYSTTVNKDVAFNYQPIGSGGGITAITAKTVDFAGSDAPLKDDQLAKAPGLLHIPTVAGAVVLAYNVQGVTSGLTLDGPTVAGIFNGDITKWNDPKLAALNAGVTLPDQDIAVVHRSDGSGTTNIFTSYLAAVSPDWQSKVGAGTTVNWPVGLGGKGNPGVAGLVKQTDGAIGYVELAYAKQNNIPYAKLKNQAGQVVDATVDSTNAATNGITIPDDFRVSIVNSADPGAWPIAGFTYLLVYKDLNNIKDAAKAKALVDYLWWAEHDGEGLTADLLYARPSAALTTKIEAELRSITFNGSPVLTK